MNTTYFHRQPNPALQFSYSHQSIWKDPTILFIIIHEMASKIGNYHPRHHVHFLSQLPIHIPQPRTLPWIAPATCSLVARASSIVLSSGSLRATIWKKSAGGQSRRSIRMQEKSRLTSVGTVVHKRPRGDIYALPPSLAPVKPSL